MFRMTPLFAICLLACKKQATDEEVAAIEASLQSQIDGLSASLEAHELRISELETQVALLQEEIATKADAESVAWLDELHSVLYTTNDGAGTIGVVLDSADLYLINGNLHVESGVGATDGAPNGKGNLIVGYDEGDGLKSGSHNIVLGSYHSYSSYGGLVVGSSNTVNSPFAGVLGGYDNEAASAYAIVTGGLTNTASANYAVIVGGSYNSAVGMTSVVVGGYDNEASGTASQVAGGTGNEAAASWASVAGGRDNRVFAESGTVGGGYQNTVYAGADLSGISCGYGDEVATSQTCVP